MSNVLLVDDMPGVRASVAYILRQQGHNVAEAGDSEEARALLGKMKTDLVITDIVMSGTDGAEFARELRAAHPDLPILAISGGATGIAAADALSAASDFVTGALAKPFNKNDLIEAVDRLTAV